jgi:hypothetical protein
MIVKIEPFSDSRILLLGRGSQGFDDLLPTKSVPDDALDDLRDFSVFIVNNSDQPIVGYSVRWEIGDTGVTKTISSVSDYWLAIPDPKLEKGVIAPGSYRFVSLAQRAGGFGGRFDNETIDGMRAQSVAVGSANNLRDKLKDGHDWRVRIDGVIFVDGRFIGENKGEFLEITRAKVDADRDFYRSLVAGLDDGRPLDALLQERLTMAEAACKASPGEKALSPAWFYQGRQKSLAQGLIGSRIRYSDEDLTRAIRLENGKQRAVIHR